MGAPPPPTDERLQKYLARMGVASRRHAEELIAAGAVSVNGMVVREQGTRVVAGRDEVRVHGHRVRAQAPVITLAMHKPRGTITSAADPEGRRTVLDLLPPEWRQERLFPVGRLDWETEGLLLLTTDGELALRLTHPRYALPKVYHALVEGHPSAATLEQLRQGVLLPGERRPTAPARAWPLGGPPLDGATWLAIELHEGRTRQVRRMCEMVGHPVRRLRRVRIGPLLLGDLAPGAVRPLTPEEVAALHRAVGLA